jgi:hypothetical protein
MVLMGYSGARGTLIYEKNLMSKISCQTPFKHMDLDLATQINYWSMRIRIPNTDPQLGLGSIDPLVCSVENDVRDPFSLVSWWLLSVFSSFSLPFVEWSKEDCFPLVGSACQCYGSGSGAPHVFGPPGSGSISQRYGSGSGSFCHHAKIVRKTFMPTILWLFILTFFFGNDVIVPSTSNKLKFFLQKLVFCWHLEGQWLK